MVHPLVRQLRFTRSEWVRGLQDVTPDEARREFPPLNTISWMVGHLAWHEQLYWLQRGQKLTLAPEVEACGSDEPRCVPDVVAMWDAWNRITECADRYLDTLTTDTLTTRFEVNGKPHRESIGTMLHRMTYHYWYHLGEAQAIRQLLGHHELPEFVGPFSDAPYTPERG